MGFSIFVWVFLRTIIQKERNGGMVVVIEKNGEGRRRRTRGVRSSVHQ